MKNWQTKFCYWIFIIKKFAARFFFLIVKIKYVWSHKWKWDAWSEIVRLSRGSRYRPTGTLDKKSLYEGSFCLLISKVKLSFLLILQCKRWPSNYFHIIIKLLNTSSSYQNPKISKMLQNWKSVTIVKTNWGLDFELNIFSIFHKWEILDIHLIASIARNRNNLESHLE